jgi:L-iditol 2-dehydrogenase
MATMEEAVKMGCHGEAKWPLKPLISPPCLTASEADALKSVLLRRDPGAPSPRASLSEVPVPALAEGDILVSMKACGLCGTDIEKLHGEYLAAMPVLGHEAVGVVTSTMGDVGELAEGDRVFPHHHVPCHRCHYCLHGNETMCKEYRGSNLDPGGFSELFRVPSWNVKGGGVLRLPPGVGFEEASMIEPAACCIRALDRCGVSADDSVLLVGAGPVGMTHALLLLSMKAKVYVSDVSEPRLAFAGRFGIHSTFNAAKDDVPASVRDLTAGRGADFAIVASGSPKAIVQAMKSVRRGGKVCLFGVPVKGSVLDYDIGDVFNSEVSIISSYAATDVETRMALGMMAEHRVDFGSLITHRFSLGDFDKAVQTAIRGEGMKTIITA